MGSRLEQIILLYWIHMPRLLLHQTKWNICMVCDYVWVGSKSQGVDVVLLFWNNNNNNNKRVLRASLFCFAQRCHTVKCCRVGVSFCLRDRTLTTAHEEQCVYACASTLLACWGRQLLSSAPPNRPICLRFFLFLANASTGRYNFISTH